MSMFGMNPAELKALGADPAGFGRLLCMIRAEMFFFSRFYPTPQAVGRR